MACAFGNLGSTNVHSHRNFPTHTYLSYVWRYCCPITKGVAAEPRASRALQPHDWHKESARYLGCENETRQAYSSSTVIVVTITNSFCG
jgi:hypothetical protein